MTVTCGAGTTLDASTGMCVADEPAAWERWADPSSYSGMSDPLAGFWGGLFGGTPTETTTPQSPGAAGGAGPATATYVPPDPFVPDWAIFGGLGLAALGLVLIVGGRSK